MQQLGRAQLKSPNIQTCNTSSLEPGREEQRQSVLTTRPQVHDHLHAARASHASGLGQPWARPAAPRVSRRAPRGPNRSPAALPRERVDPSESLRPSPGELRREVGGPGPRARPWDESGRDCAGRARNRVGTLPAGPENASASSRLTRNRVCVQLGVRRHASLGSLGDWKRPSPPQLCDNEARSVRAVIHWKMRPAPPEACPSEFSLACCRKVACCARDAGAPTR